MLEQTDCTTNMKPSWHDQKHCHSAAKFVHQEN
jgi:hypothetical protein